MSQLCLPAFRFLAALAIIAGISFCETSASGQEPETTKLITADGVKLSAMFYPSSKKNAPTVIMLHPIGEGKSSKAKEWKDLAAALQKAEYSVLTFDFRGHGESTTIDDAKLFWSKPINAVNVRPKDKKDDTIDVKDYIKAGGAYLPVLVNDIAAARAFLDRRSDDTKDCSTSNLIVIGADSGATLGALWMNAEWHRFKYTPNPMFPAVFNPKLLETRPEGKDIIAAVFLTVQPTLEKRTVSISGLLKVACKDNGTAVAFFCGDEDAKAKKLAETLEANLKAKNSKKHDYIWAAKLPTNLTGVKLLNKGLDTDKHIVKYLDAVVDERKNERVEREFMASYYMWKTPLGGQFIRARNDKREKTLNFDDFNKFIAQ